MPLTLNGVLELLPKAVSGPIFDRAAEASLVQRLAPKIPTTLSGTAIPVTVGEIEADWVAEGAEKYVADASATVLIMEPKKVATIVVVSEEFFRSNPGGLYDQIRERAGEALGRAFDIAALHGKRTVGAGAGPFTTYVNQTTQEIALGTTTKPDGGLEGDLIGGQALVTDFNGYGLDKTVRARLANTRDAQGRVMVAGTDTVGGVRAEYGTAVHKGDPLIAGWGGDWAKCAYGVGLDITAKVTDQASVKIGGTLTSLWQTNQVGLLLEAAYGFVVHQPALNFVRYLEPVVTL